MCAVPITRPIDAVALSVIDPMHRYMLEHRYRLHQFARTAYMKSDPS